VSGVVSRDCSGACGGGPRSIRAHRESEKQERPSHHLHPDLVPLDGIDIRTVRRAEQATSSAPPDDNHDCGWKASTLASTDPGVLARRGPAVSRSSCSRKETRCRRAWFRRSHDEEANAGGTQSDRRVARANDDGAIRTRFLRTVFLRTEVSAARRVGGVGPELPAAAQRRRLARCWARFAAAQAQRALHLRESRGGARRRRLWLEARARAG